jgi:hypothetical protein
MKSLPLAAAALLVGTSAFALPPSTPPAAAPAVAKPAYFAAVQTAAAHAAFHDHAVAGAWSNEDARLEAASAAGNPDLDLAVDPDVEQASLTGMGGPEEPLDLAPAPEALAAADIAPRPAAQNYPACRPGPGDDNCIQLYEPGVQVALAGWTQPTGGFADSEASAIGGPYEPVEGAAGETAMAGDGVLDTDMGETAKDEEEVGI